MALVASRRLRLAVCGITIGALAACAVPTPYGGTSPGFGEQPCGTPGSDRPGYRDVLDLPPLVARRLSGAGSTFVAPVMSTWARRYADERGVRVAYQPIGSGGGVAQVTAGTVDFGASDTPMTAVELAKAGGRPVLQIPVTLGAVVPAYHLPGLGSGLRFDGETLGRIYTGAINRWNDPALRKLNPTLRLPDLPIVVIHRSDSSGTTAVWTEYLTKASPSWVSAVGAGKSSGKQVVWPVGLAGKGNDGVAAMLAQVDGGIAYIELSYALSQGVPYGQVRNRSGNSIQPCPATVTKATEGLVYPSDLTVSLTDGPDPDAYPITGLTYLLVYARQPDLATATGLVGFFAWALTVGQDLVAALGYAPLGPRLQRLAYAKLGSITVDGAAVLGTPAGPGGPGRRIGGPG
jgi:phosphate transport system substrate-binding protein